jgi:sec-independent protein translocase protein TatA
MIPEQANLLSLGNPWDVAIIAGVVVLLFGGSKLGSFGKQVGEGIREFKKASKEALDEPVAPAAAPAPVAATPVTPPAAEPQHPASVAATNDQANGAPKGTQQ